MSLALDNMCFSLGDEYDKKLESLKLADHEQDGHVKKHRCALRARRPAAQS